MQDALSISRCHTAQLKQKYNFHPAPPKLHIVCPGRKPTFHKLALLRLTLKIKIRSDADENFVIFFVVFSVCVN